MPSPTPPRSATADLWLAFTVIAAGVFVVYLDVLIVNVAFPSMRASFPDVGISGLSWVLNAYAIGFAAMLVPGGRLVDLIGRRRGFAAGMAVFTVASALCAAAPSAALLVAARVVQSAGAAVVIPASLALLLATFPPERRVAAIGAWAGVAAVGAGLGPVVGGVLVESSWRWVFLVNVPFGAAAVAMAHRTLTESRDPARGRTPDVIGIILLGASVGLLALGIVEGPDWGWTGGRVLGAFAGSAVLMALFIVRCVTHDAPAIELDLLRSRRFSAANIASLLFTGAMGAMILASVLFVQGAWGYTPIQTGLGVAPGAVLAGLGSVVMGRMGRGLRVRPVCAGGCALFIIGVAWWLWRLGPESHYVRDMLPGSILTGFGIGVVQPVMTAVAATSVPPQRFATGGAILNVARQIGTVLGIALVVALLGEHPSVARFDHAWLLIIGAAVAAIAASMAITPPPARAD